MATAPDFYVQTVNVQEPYDPLLATDQWFIVGFTEKGPVTPQRHTSLEAWEETYGGTIAYGQLHEEAEMYFAEGGRNLVTQRVVGPAPVKASSTLMNTAGTPAATIKLEATDYGAYGNAITRQVIAGPTTGVVIKIVTPDKATTSPELLTVQAAVDYFADGASGVTASALPGGGLPAVVSAAALSGGTDDNASAADGDYADALGLLDKRLGPGQVSMPGRTTDTARDQLRAHCDQAAFDRVSLVDLADSGDESTLTGAVSGEEDDVQSGTMFVTVPWVVNPDANELPPCGYTAAKIAAMDRATGNPNEPAAGANGQARWITGLTQDFTDAQRAVLAGASINPIHDVDLQGTLQLYDFVTLNQSDPLMAAFSNARLDMRIRWHARKVAQPLLFKQIDPQGLLAANYASRLEGMLKIYQGLGALYGFVVDTKSVNTPETAAAKTLNARIGVQRSPFARFEYLTVSNYQVDVNLAEVAA